MKNFSIQLDDPAGTIQALRKAASLLRRDLAAPLLTLAGQIAGQLDGTETIRLTAREIAELSTISRRHPAKVVLKWNSNETADLIDPPKWATDWLAERRKG